MDFLDDVYLTTLPDRVATDGGTVGGDPLVGPRPDPRLRCGTFLLTEF